MYVIWVCQLTTVKVPCVCCHSSAGSFQVLHLQLRNSLGRVVCNASQTCFEEWQTRRYGLRIPAGWANWALDGQTLVTVKLIGMIKWKFFELSRIRNQNINTLDYLINACAFIIFNIFCPVRSYLILCSSWTEMFLGSNWKEDPLKRA